MVHLYSAFIQSAAHGVCIALIHRWRRKKQPADWEQLGSIAQRHFDKILYSTAGGATKAQRVQKTLFEFLCALCRPRYYNTFVRGICKVREK